MNTPIIPIFYACDDMFVRYTVVSLHSMIVNAAKDRHYHIYILHTSISDEMKAAVRALENENFTVSFEDVTKHLHEIAEKLPIRDYYSKTTYYRLFIPEMFPALDKAIYIDSDTVVQGDIAKLYDTDIGDRLVGACHEQAMVQDDIFGTYCEKVVGVSRHNFFNAGLILMNCKAFRERKILDKFYACLQVYNFVVTQDEDYLNLLCKDRVFWLDQRWNTEMFGAVPYPAEEAFVLHYIMVSKPWHYEDCRCGDVFWRYAKETSVYEDLRAELAAYTDEEKERDRLSAEGLHQLALQETAREDNYVGRLDKTLRSPDRVAIVKKIEDFEREGRFTEDVEDDPPSRMLEVGEVDYLRRKFTSKVKQWYAYRLARRFLNGILKDKKLIIKEIRGIENWRALDAGAVVTCNHFNAFDTFAMHVAYMASGHKKNKLYRVIREGNYTSFPGFYGFLMRNFYTLPLSSNRAVLREFLQATDRLLQDGNFVLVYPEQSMWWNYRKPKPLQSGAFHIAAKSGCPVLPCFITMQDSDILGEDGYYVQEYTIHIGEPIYPQKDKTKAENAAYLMEQNAAVWREIYEREYGMPLVYTTEQSEG